MINYYAEDELANALKSEKFNGKDEDYRQQKLI